MVIVLKHGIKDSDKQFLKDFLEARNMHVREIQGEEETILGAVGRLTIDSREVEILPGVAQVIPISKPYKLASREFKKEDTIVQVGPIKIGGNRIAVIAGPCAVESRQQMLEIAHAVRESGAVILRGGAFKPRTSPYAFQGLGEEGLKYLKEAGEATGMPVTSEIVSPLHIEMMKEYVDLFQIGARNMQNFELLKVVGAQNKPVILKRGLAATIEELLMSAEYLLASGTDDVILCERGIRTFETYTRNTLDLSAIPVVKKLSHLPIVVDPSHATGLREKVLPMALSGITAGADGIIVEVHNDPNQALSDGPQSIYPEQFEKLMRNIEALSPVIEKEVSRLPEFQSASRLSPGSSPDAGSVQKQPAPQPGKTGTGEQPIRVAFQGERGAFSEKAIKRYFDDQVLTLPCPSFQTVFDSVLAGKARFGILPIENSLAGSIHENYDLLLQYPDLKIVGEKKIRIVHNLITLPGVQLEEIERVYSHPQGLAQCAKFLDKYPQWERIPYYDTAGSVAMIAAKGIKANAAIASSEAAEAYKMHILKEGIETNANNYTRFVVITRAEAATVYKPDKASLVFSVVNKPGSLFACLKTMADKTVNLTKLESRPIHGKPWEYMFYIDVEIPADYTLFEQAIGELRKTAEDFHVLGLYKK